jgi:hypothetical protein
MSRDQHELDEIRTWKNHPSIPWIVALICLIALGLTAWFAVPVFMKSPRTQGVPVQMPIPEEEGGQQGRRAYFP